MTAPKAVQKLVDAWTDAESATIEEWWGRESAEKIAARLDGRTRNSVIGKARRLGLKQLKPATTQGPRRRKLGNPHPKPETVREPQRATAPPEEEEMSIPFAMPLHPERAQRQWKPLLECGPHDCRWPEDLENLDRRAERFCAAPVIEGKSYCPEHYARAFRTVVVEGRRAAA